jgi:flagellar hook capping protein FlgD
MKLSILIPLSSFIQSALQGHFYKIAFNDDNSEEIKYTVIDSTNGDTLIWNDDIEIVPNSGVLFDGVSLSFENKSFGLNEQKTGWKPGAQSNSLASIINAFNYKKILADYEIRFSDVIMDTAVTNVLTPFQIWNITENKKIKFAVTEKSQTRNGAWDLGEAIFILEGGTSNKDIAWQIIFNADSLQTAPQQDDVFLLATDKPFSSGDVYLLDMSVLGIETDDNLVLDGFELYQNYPNPFNGQTTVTFALAQNAPVQIEIFNTLGQQVLHKELGRLSPGQHRFVWDARNTHKNIISSGIYYYRIKVGKKLSKVSKMILVK